MEAFPHSMSRAVWAVRAALCAALYACVQHHGRLQLAVDALWARLHEQWWYRSVHMETGFVALYYFAVYWAYVAASKFRVMKQYELSREGDAAGSTLWQGGSIRGLLGQAAGYILPLAVLDRFTRKYYHGVDEQAWAAQPLGWQVRPAAPWL